MKIEVYSKDPCPHCVRAKQLLAREGLPFEEVSAVEHRDDLIARVEAATGETPKQVPQIFIGDQHIGGADDLEKYLRARKVGVVEVAGNQVIYTIDRAAIEEGQQGGIDIEAEVRAGIEKSA